MIIGQNEIQTRVIRDRLLSALGERDTIHPEGAGRDLRIGAAYRLAPRSRPFIEEDISAKRQGRRRGSFTAEIVRYQKGRQEQPFLTIEPGTYVLVETIEVLHTPGDLMPMWYPRSTLMRNGLLLLTTKIDPGYKGKLVAGLVNLGPARVRLQMGARIANIVFHRIAGRTVQYRGQHQGGRVNTGEVEEQV